MRICAVVPEKDAALPPHTQRTATLMRSSTAAINFTFGELGGPLRIFFELIVDIEAQTDSDTAVHSGLSHQL